MIKFLFMLVFLSSLAWSSEALQTSSFEEVSQKIQELRGRFSTRDVLIVLDIDNTLLRTNQTLGSDQWFEWQNEAIKNHTSDAAFKTFEELLRAQSIFYQISGMSLTEPVIPKIVADWGRSGHQMFLLTSRGPDIRNVTERELKRNGLWFANTSVMRGLPQEFMETPFKLPVSFMNGIFMTSGHHKGEALEYILRKSGRRYKAIIFVDDHEKHTKRVFDQFSTKRDIEIFTFRYGKEDPKVLAFKQGSKGTVQAQTRELLSTMGRIFK